MSCGEGCRCGSDPSLLRRLWRRPGATVLIRPLAWEPPNAMGVAPEKAKRQKKKKRQKEFALCAINLDKCVSFVDHYGITHNRALKLPCSSPIHPSPLNTPRPGHHCYFAISIVLPFRERHIIGII